MNKDYKVVDGTSYLNDAPDGLVQVLEKARKNHTRICLSYGSDEIRSGYVARTCGDIKVPILLHNSRSLGGDCIIETLITEVRTSYGKMPLWKRR